MCLKAEGVLPRGALEGIAVLGGIDFRQTAAFTVQHHQLDAPLVEVAFEDALSSAAWTITVRPFQHLDAALQDFMIELQSGALFGALLGVHRDVTCEWPDPR
jgi:hypothetical protein